MKKMQMVLAAGALLLGFSGAAEANITVWMEAWDVLPQAQITKGNNENCEANETVYGPQSMPKGFRRDYPDAGTDGVDICWRRTADPFNSSSSWGVWNRCSSDGDCEIR